MALKALTIIEEEFKRCLDEECEPELDGPMLIALRDAIKERIMQECIEIPECDGCHEYPAADRFMRQDAASLPPFKTNLCGDCVRALKEDGVSIEHVKES
jgi:hypothetical protein